MSLFTPPPPRRSTARTVRDQNTSSPRTPVPGYKGEFKARFRHHAFGWRSQPAVQRVKEAVREIKVVARRDPLLAADGAVGFLERVSAALERVDSSSGARGTAVNNAIRALVPVIADAPAEMVVRYAWLEQASRSPCEPSTLARAARDFAEKQTAFAVGAGLLSLQWLVAGYGYEVTSPDVRAAYTYTSLKSHWVSVQAMASYGTMKS